MGNKLKIFFHYHPNDEKHFSDIFKQLPRSIRKESICEILHPGLISAGQNRKQTYQSWIDTCNLFIPISTSDYWGTDLGEEEYIPFHDQALGKAKKLATVPIIVQSHVDADEVYEDMQVLPTNRKPISTIADEYAREEVWKHVAQEIRSKVQTLSDTTNDNSDLIQIFSESIYRLNYREQKKEVYDHFKNLSNNFKFNRLNILFLQGTPFCGHNLLIDILRKKEYNIEMETEPEAIPLDMTNLQAKGLWRELKTALLLKDVPYNKPAEIAQNIHQRLNIEHIVLRFENFGQCDKNAVLACIKTFWYELNSELEKISSQPPKHSLFIFILDKSLKFSYSLADFKPTADTDQHNKVLQLLPVISPLTEAEFDLWVKPLYDLDGTKFRELHEKLCGCGSQIIPADQADGVYVRQAIEQMADLLELSAHKNEIIQQLKL